ncbi:MAG: pyruvate formate lyase-activating protein [Dehalococcoidia bacterium]|nr:pyruvate formate lyase-activating protein [Dehalococcoidia bacterium]
MSPRPSSSSHRRMLSRSPTVSSTSVKSPEGPGPRACTTERSNVKILAVDIGTGTQDILLFDSGQPIENSVKLVMPAPTAIAASRVRDAAASGDPVIFTGRIQGGGPVHWAAEDYLQSGGVIYATDEAARTFDDDLANVQTMGIHLVSADEAVQCSRAGSVEIVLRDLDLNAIRAALAAFGIAPGFDGIALGCLDHGNAPPGYSDRLFRFEHLSRVIETGRGLHGFALLPEEIPGYLTRAAALMASADGQAERLLFTDTGPAAALGALQDEAVAGNQRVVVLNVGNMHTLAFDLAGTSIQSLFEHHSGELSGQQIADFTLRLSEGGLSHEEVYSSKGHGTLYVGDVRPDGEPFFAVTGPQRDKVRGRGLEAHFAAPHGDMMLSGCFGLLDAFAGRFQDCADEIRNRLAPPVVG